MIAFTSITLLRSRSGGEGVILFFSAEFFDAVGDPVRAGLLVVLDGRGDLHLEFGFLEVGQSAEGVVEALLDEVRDVPDTSAQRSTFLGLAAEVRALVRRGRAIVPSNDHLRPILVLAHEIRVHAAASLVLAIVLRRVNAFQTFLCVGTCGIRHQDRHQ